MLGYVGCKERGLPLGLQQLHLGDIQLWISILQIFRVSKAFCKGNVGAEFLANEGASGVIVEYFETTLLMQLRIWFEHIGMAAFSLTE